jgi:hypothetical protein
MQKVKSILIVIWSALILLMAMALFSTEGFKAENIAILIFLELAGVGVLTIIFKFLSAIANKVKKDPSIGKSTYNKTNQMPQKKLTKPVRVLNLNVISGKETFGLKSKYSAFSIKQWDDGFVTVADGLEKYELFDYAWNGPEYKAVTTTTSTSKTKGKSKEKTGRKGRLTGAVIGSMVVPVPVVGAAIGAAVGTGKKSKGKNNSTTTGNTTTTSNNVEVDSIASVKFRNIETEQISTVGFYCNSVLDMQLKSFNIVSKGDVANNVKMQKSSVELLKEYKELLDSGVITQEEFMQKKAELL